MVLIVLQYVGACVCVCFVTCVLVVWVFNVWVCMCGFCNFWACVCGKDNINTEQHKCAPEEFKLRLLQFLNNVYRKIPSQMNGEMPL